MKKLTVLLSILTILAISAFAQTPAPKGDFKPGMGGPECPGYEKFHKGMNFKGHGEKWDNNERGGPFGPGMFEMLELTDEQMDKMHAVKVKFQKQEIDLRADQKKLKIDKHEAMREMKFEDARKVTKKMADITAKLEIMQIDEKEEMSKILTKDQLEKFKDLHGKKGMMKNKMKHKN